MDAERTKARTDQQFGASASPKAHDNLSDSSFYIPALSRVVPWQNHRSFPRLKVTHQRMLSRFWITLQFQSCCHKKINNKVKSLISGVFTDHPEASRDKGWVIQITEIHF